MLEYLAKVWRRFLVSYALVPALIFIGFGGYAIWKQDLVFPMLFSFAVGALLVVGFLLLSKKGKGESVDAKYEDMPNIETSSEWTEKELEIWEKSKLKIDAYVDTPFDIPRTKEDIVDLVDFIAREATGDKKRGYLSFTTPEVLLMLEEVSRRYRIYLDENVPLVNSLKISRLKMAYDHKDKAKMAWNMYRVFRLTSPAGIASEIRGILTEGIADEMTESAFASLRRVFFQEIASVAIDLYAGRFVLVKNELSDVAKSDLDKIKDIKDCKEPIRVTIVGQTSAGKSTLKNSIFGDLKSEVGVLATTDRDIVSQINLNGSEFHVIDTVGYNHEKDTLSDTLNRIQNSDIVIWCLKSNQPSKKPDTDLATEIEAYYVKNYRKVKPAFIFALTHSDQVEFGVHDELYSYALNLLSERLSLPKYNIVLTDNSGAGIGDIYKVIQDETEHAMASRMNRKRLDNSNKSVIHDVKSEIKRAKTLAGKIKEVVSSEESK